MRILKVSDWGLILKLARAVACNVVCHKLLNFTNLSYLSFYLYLPTFLNESSVNNFQS